MAAAVKSETGKAERGKVRFELEKGGETVSVHLDKHGFRRLLETLQRLAETGENQTFDKSGRVRSGNKNGAAVSKMVFHIESQS